jgi:hypothetical protein
MGRQESQGSLFAAINEGLASQSQSSRLQKYEIGLGLLGFWTLMTLIVTVVATLRGEPAVLEAVVAACFVGMTWLTYRRWRDIARHVNADLARRGGRGPGTPEREE